MISHVSYLLMTLRFLITWLNSLFEVNTVVWKFNNVLFTSILCMMIFHLFLSSHLVTMLSITFLLLCQLGNSKIRIGFIMRTKGIFAMKSQNYCMKQYLNGQIFIYLQIMCSNGNREVSCWFQKGIVRNMGQLQPDLTFI